MGIVATMTDESQESGPSFEIVSQIIKLLEPLGVEDRTRVLRTVNTWLRTDEHPAQLTMGIRAGNRVGDVAEDEKFSNRPVMSVKDFIFEKNPETESERMACLAYYLTHYLDKPHFKTVDLTRLNIDAAQRTFSNPAVATSNAVRDGFFVAAPKGGFRQLSAMGERFVHALPDREAANAVKKRMVVRRRRRSIEQSTQEQSQSENQTPES